MSRPEEPAAHPVQQGFCFTYNKLQGATVARLILVLNDLSKCRLGNMSIHKLYVALSRVRFGKHLAIMPVRDGGLLYLLEKKYSSKLLAWNGNYNAQGWWRTDVVLVLADVDAAFEKIRGVGGLRRANKTALGKVCSLLDIYRGKKTERQLRAALLPCWEAFLRRRAGEAPLPRPAAAAAARGAATARGRRGAARGRRVAAATRGAALRAGAAAGPRRSTRAAAAAAAKRAADFECGLIAVSGSHFARHSNGLPISHPTALRGALCCRRANGAALMRSPWTISWRT